MALPVCPWIASSPTVRPVPNTVFDRAKQSISLAMIWACAITVCHQSALKEGLSGRSYQGVRPGRIGHRFAEIHGAAYLVYRAREKVTSIDDDIH